MPEDAPNPYAPPEQPADGHRLLLDQPLTLSDKVACEGRHPYAVGKKAYRVHWGWRFWLNPALGVLTMLGALGNPGAPYLWILTSIFFLGFFLSIFRVRRFLKKMDRESIGLFQWHRFELGREGCNILSPRSFSSLHWSQFIRYKEGKEVVLLYQQAHLFSILHRELFETDLDYDKALEHIREHLPKKR